MKIAIVSDTHLGYKETDSDLKYDSYVALYQIFNNLPEDIDLILMPGDVFDSEEPSQETFDFAFKIFSVLVSREKNHNLDLITKIPIIVIPGTHEYKGNEYITPLDVLESAKYIKILKNEHFIYEKNDEKINIFGLKGIPEKYVRDVINKLNILPKNNVNFNIFMFHQSLNEFLPYDDEMVANLTIEDLPDGFDLYVDGHIHKPYELKENKWLLIAGSTIVTQIKGKELAKKGYWILDTNLKNLEFIAIENQRKFYLYEIDITDKNLDEIYKEINSKISKIKTLDKIYFFNKEIVLKPVIKIKLKGTLNKGYEISDIKEKDFLNDNYVFILDKNIVKLEEILEKIDFNQDKEHALKRSEEIFLENLKKTDFKNSFDPEILINLLKQNNYEKALEYLKKLK